VGGRDGVDDRQPEPETAVAAGAVGRAPLEGLEQPPTKVLKGTPERALRYFDGLRFARELGGAT
jgi:hypothetical protein